MRNKLQENTDLQKNLEKLVKVSQSEEWQYLLAVLRERAAKAHKALIAPGVEEKKRIEYAAQENTILQIITLIKHSKVTKKKLQKEAEEIAKKMEG